MSLKLSFENNLSAHVPIQSLEKLGWHVGSIYNDIGNIKDLSKKEAIVWKNEHYHVEIKVNKEGNFTWRTVNSDELAMGIDNRSEGKETGDNEKTIQDLKKIHAKGWVRYSKNINYQELKITGKLNLELTKEIQENRHMLKNLQEGRYWEIKESVTSLEEWNLRQAEMLLQLDSFMLEATKEDLIAILTKKVFRGKILEKSIYTI
jgi:hypothetical protein